MIMATGMNTYDHGAPMSREPALELSDLPPKSSGITAEERPEINTDSPDELDGPQKASPKDALDMRRMGKEQTLTRRFRQITIAAFIGTTTSAWEYALFLVSPGVVDGGIAGLLYNVIWAMLGFGTIYLSLAEMASMAPIAGSLYHWVSEFAPENVQAVLSYFTGYTEPFSTKRTARS